MSAYRGFVLVLSSAAMLTLPVLAAAQAPQITLAVGVGQKVKVTVVDGRTIKGKVLNLTPGSIELPGISVPVSDVQRVQVLDPIGDGAGKGALILGALGALIGAGADSFASSFGSESNGSYFLLGAGVGLATGVAFGAGLDALQMETFYAPNTQNHLPIAVGQTVRITDNGGRVTGGTVHRLTPGAIDVAGGNENAASVSVADVRSIQVPDPVKNGVINGALAGVVVGWRMLTRKPAIDSGNHEDAAFFGTIAAGALLGWSIDKVRMQTIYERADAGMTVSVRPIASAAGKGLGVEVRW